MAVLAAPDAASAQAGYSWIGPSHGNWNDAANWMHTSGPVGPGYPSQPEDAASFAAEVTADRTIIIPSLVTATLGVLTIETPFRITITGGGTLVFDNGANSARLARSGAGLTDIHADIDLASNLHIDTGGAGASISFTRTISESGGARSLVFDGQGTTTFENTAANAYTGSTTVLNGIVRSAWGVPGIPGDLIVGDDIGEPGTAQVDAPIGGHILRVLRDGMVSSFRQFGGGAGPNFDEIFIRGGKVSFGGLNQHVVTGTLTMEGGTLTTGGWGCDVTVNGAITATSIAPMGSFPGGRAIISGGGPSDIGWLRLKTAAQEFTIADGPEAIDAEFDIPMSEAFGAGAVGVNKLGPGAAVFARDNTYTGETTVTAGTLFINSASPSSAIAVAGGRLGGTGTVGALNAATGIVAPGTSPGTLHSGPLVLGAGVTFDVEIESFSAGGSDRLKVTGGVDIGDAILSLAAPLALPAAAPFTIIDNDGTDAVVGTFAGLGEGATVTAPSGATFRISYAGGDGNDVVLTNTSPASYFLSEGATGTFFDEDVSIANANLVDAPVTLTFLLPGGGTIVEPRTVPAQSRLTVKVDEIDGLENASASVQVTSTTGLPLAVERTMYWDAAHYAGHTATAVDQPRTEWHFAEGSQGFFNTYLLLANANAQATAAEVTFLREGKTPFTTTVGLPAFSRVTVYAGDYAELADTSFGMTITAPLPITADRAMYFQTTPARLWSGGHANTGTAAPSTSWFHPEGATGTFFSTFILISNPSATTAAGVGLRFLLPNGEVIETGASVPPQGRVTFNPAAIDDPRLQNAAFSTVVTSDVPVVSERAMYWTKGALPFGEGHASSGLTSTALTWDLAEGRSGGPAGYTTYILLANPSANTADVTVTFLRDAGAPVTKTFSVPAFSRYNVDVGVDAPELAGESFGARVHVTNGVGIAVERSMYWNANGIFWAAGTNAAASPLPQE